MKNKIQIRLLTTLILISGTISVLMAKPNNPFKLKSDRKKNSCILNPKLKLAVVKNGDKIAAFWSANDEPSGNSYILERSKNGTDFKKVSQVNVSKTAHNVTQYIETDCKPLKGVSYYRLKCTNNKNNGMYSNTVVVNYAINKVSANFGIGMQNNEELINSIKRLPSNKVLVVLRDKNGSEFYSKISITVENADIIGYDSKNKLAPGTYLVTGSSNNILYGQNVIIR